MRDRKTRKAGTRPCGNRALVTALLILLAPSAALFAWDWPLNSPLIMTDFADKLGTSFATGMTLAGSSGDVHSVDSGEVIYFSPQGDRRNRQFSSPLGNMVVVQHDNGFRSSYAGLAAIASDNFGKGANPYLVKSGQTLGTAVKLDDSLFGPLVFSISDYRYGGFVNPQLVLPLLQDDRSPLIASVEYSLGDSALRNDLSDRIEVFQARIKIFAQFKDVPGATLRSRLSQKPVFALPQTLTVSLNGKTIYTARKLTLVVDGKSRMALQQNPFGSFDQVYPDDAYVSLGEIVLAPGLNRLDIRASDIIGNRASAGYRITYTAPPASP